MDLKALIKDAGVLWQHTAEFEAFLQFIIDQQIESILEIGTGYGASAYCFGEVTNHGLVVSVDFGTMGAAKVWPHKRRQQPNPNFVQIDGDSRTDEVEDLVSSYMPFDMVYFDTEHPFETCMDNLTRYGPMAQRFIAQHDINMAEDSLAWPNAGVPRFWRDVLSKKGVVAEYRMPAPDPRFPRWGGIGVVSARQY